jgi:hypothetical protein
MSRVEKLFMMHKIVLLQIKTHKGLSETINQWTGNAMPGRKKDIGKNDLQSNKQKTTEQPVL